MSETTAPGWYPDPDDPSLIRHWDGRAWGDERRPRPDWAAPRDRSPRSRPDGGRRRWLVLGGSVAAALAMALLTLMIVSSGPDLPDQTVFDTGFHRRANAICARALPPLRQARPEPREDAGSKAEVADRVDKVADDLGDVAEELRGLPVASDDAAEVAAWLDDWESYVAIGHRYADAVRDGDEEEFTAIAAQGHPLARAVFRFAQANKMPDCVFT